MATMLILKNKEETIRVQAESLSLAEARIAALNSKAHKHQEQQTCPFATTRSSADGNHVEMIDVSASVQTDCICGLEEENKKLKQRSETMEAQIGELRRRVSELELALEDKENIDEKYQKQIEEKEKELHRIRQQLSSLERGTREQGSACDTLTLQMQQLEDMLNDKTAELMRAQQKVESQEATIRDLREQLHRADLIVSENQQVRAEVSCLSTQVSQWRQQLADSRRRLRALEAELRRAREHCRHLASHYREKAQTASTLQAQLSEAQERGAMLCAEAQRAVRGVRRWLAAQRDRRREQDDKIKEQEIVIQTLRSDRTSTSENEPCRSKYLPRVEARRSDRSCMRASESTGCSKCAYSRLNIRTSESDAASPSPPTPPRRMLRKKPLCVERPCQCPLTREAAAQRPARGAVLVDAQMSCDSLHSCRGSVSRETSPPEELLERVERAHEALAAAQRRWGRRGHDMLDDVTRGTS